MVFQDCQDMVQITERIQVIRLCRFRYAIDNRAGFRTINAVDQLPRMFVQAEAAERSSVTLLSSGTSPSVRNTFSASS